MQYQFSYAPWPQATVTVRASSEDEARLKARDVLDRRYEKRGEEPPVGRTLTLLRAYDLHSKE